MEPVFRPPPLLVSVEVELAAADVADEAGITTNEVDVCPSEVVTRSLVVSGMVVVGVVEVVAGAVVVGAVVVGAVVVGCVVVTGSEVVVGRSGVVVVGCVVVAGSVVVGVVGAAVVVGKAALVVTDCVGNRPCRAARVRFIDRADASSRNTCVLSSRWNRGTKKKKRRKVARKSETRHRVAKLIATKRLGC